MFEKLTTGLLFLLNEVHFKCTALVDVVVKAGGEVLCLDLNPGENVKSHEFHCLGAAGKENWCKEDVNNVCVGLVTPKLPVVLNKSEKEGFEVALGKVNYLVNVFADI